jgi:hypothetical protein
MENPTLYKKVPLSDVKNRNTSVLSEDEKISSNNIINTFFDLFKQKHL